MKDMENTNQVRLNNPSVERYVFPNIPRLVLRVGLTGVYFK